MTDPATCPDCGAPLPADAAADQPCPRCLLASALPDRDGDASEAPPEAVARLFPELELRGVVGRGGMGVVYEARQIALDRVVALKLLPESLLDEPGFADRFTREARTMARLDHPNIVRVHDFGDRGGRFYLLMEFVEGPNLRRVIDSGGLAPEEALRIVPQICEALQYAHDRGVVHRDVKPENILLDASGQVKVTDFGLAKLLDHDPAEHTLTQAGQVMGTPRYMAPEQYRTPGDVDHRADIYSLGVVFYEMLTGDVPMGRFEAPSERVAVDVRLDDVVLRTLERERERRYQRADDVRSEVTTIAAGAPPPPPAVPAASAVPEPSSSRLSRLALWGFLCTPAALVLSPLVTTLAYYAAGDGEGGAGLGIGIVVALVLLFVGFFTSIAGWIQVARSDGRLTGLGFAVIGTILPIPLFLMLAGMSLLLLTGVRAPDEGWETMDYGAEFGEIEPMAPSLAGAPRRASPRARIEAAWSRIRGETHSGLRQHVADVDRHREDLLREDDRKRLRKDALLGLGYRHDLLAQLTAPEVTKVEAGRDGASATVRVKGRNGKTLAFPMVEDGASWSLAPGPVVEGDAPPRWTTPDRFPSGPDDLVERRAVQTDVEMLWSIVQRYWESGKVPLAERIPRADVRWLLPPSRRKAWVNDTNVALAERWKDGSMGLLFLDASELPRPLREYAIEGIVPIGTGRAVQVTATAAGKRLRFQVAFELGRGWLALEPVTIEG